MPLKRTPLNKGTKKLLTKTSIKGMSSKRGKQMVKYHKVIKGLVEEDNVCSGCGSYNNLTNSHLIPRSKREDLIDNPRNIRKHCTSIGDKIGCHQKWESHSHRRELWDYHENMIIVKELDPQYYQFLLMKEEKFYG